MEKERPSVEVVNIITHTLIVPPFDLTKLTEAIAFDSLNSALSRIPVTCDKTKFSIFRSGAVVGRGSKTIDTFEKDLLAFYDYLKSFQLNLKLEYDISNIVGVAKLEAPILNLFALANQISTSSYDPSAADSKREGTGCDVIVYPLSKKKPKKTILIFSSSAITLTGFRSLPDLKNEAYKFQELLHSILKKHPEVIREK